MDSHIFIVEVLRQGSLVGQAAADVQAVQLRADGLELAVNLYALGQFVPVLGSIPDAGVDEEVEHLQVEVGVLGHRVLVELEDVGIADAQAGGIEVEVGLFLRCDADTHHGVLLNEVGQILELVLVVQYRDDVLPAVLAQLGDVVDVVGALEAIADDVEFLLVHGTVTLQGLDEVQVVGR